MLIKYFYCYLHLVLHTHTHTFCAYMHQWRLWLLPFKIFGQPIKCKRHQNSRIFYQQTCHTGTRWIHSDHYVCWVSADSLVAITAFQSHLQFKFKPTHLQYQHAHSYVIIFIHLSKQDIRLGTWLLHVVNKINVFKLVWRNLSSSYPMQAARWGRWCDHSPLCVTHIPSHTYTFNNTCN